MVGDLMQYEQALKAHLIACEHLARPVEMGLIAPEANLITSARLYAVAEYPRIIHTLQELCGQGLVMRFPKDALRPPGGSARAWPSCCPGTA